MENILTENHEKVEKSQETTVNIPIDENWFIKEVCEKKLIFNLLESLLKYVIKLIVPLIGH